MNVRTGVDRALVQWAVLSSNCLPRSMEVIGHDIEEVKVTVDLERCSFLSPASKDIVYSTCKIFGSTVKVQFFLTLNNKRNIG